MQLHLQHLWLLLQLARGLTCHSKLGDGCNLFLPSSATFLSTTQLNVCTQEGLIRIDKGPFNATIWIHLGKHHMNLPPRSGSSQPQVSNVLDCDKVRTSASAGQTPDAIHASSRDAALTPSVLSAEF